jgi:hypothetical protein
MPKGLLTLTSLAVALFCLPCGLRAAENDADKLFQQMKQLSQKTVVAVKTNEEKIDAELIAAPVFRYSDQPRKIIDASLWAWVHDGRLVALQKIEATNSIVNQPRWTYCFASFTSAPLEVRWSNGESFETKGSEVKFQDVPNAPAPSEKPFVRLQQMKQVAARFSATISGRKDGSDLDTMRLFPKPVFLHPQHPELPTLVVFGFSSSGTNPDAYLVLQVDADGEGSKWTYALRRMTTGAVTVKLDDDTVWETKWLRPVGGAVDEEAWMLIYENRKEP